MEGIWFTEKQTPTVALSCLTERVLCTRHTPYQELKIIETPAFGRVLLLDNVIQTTTADEFIYHEMITLVPLNTHPSPSEVLVVGGGDGGSIREIVKHPRVEKVNLVEIDAEVIRAAKEYLPFLSVSFEDPKIEITIGDGISHVQKVKNKYDVIIIDSTDPVGPAAGLFSAAFYKEVYEALKEDGLFVAQTASPFFNQEFLRRIYQDVKTIFPLAKVYLACVPTYPGGLWSFTLGSKRYDPEEVKEENLPPLLTRYYNFAVHRAAFTLPNFIATFLNQ